MFCIMQKSRGGLAVDNKYVKAKDAIVQIGEIAERAQEREKLHKSEFCASGLIKKKRMRKL